MLRKPQLNFSGTAINAKLVSALRFLAAALEQCYSTPALLCGWPSLAEWL
jgi:hypothetical protein